MKNKIHLPILITGATGFIGSHLSRFLVNSGYTIHLIVRNKSNLWRINDFKKKANIHFVDLLEFKKVQKLIKKIKPKTIFHLSTYGAYSFQSNRDNIKKINLDASLNLLDSCQSVPFKIFINTGTNSEYGFKNKPMKEDDILTPNSNYAVFKSSFTNYCQFLAKSKKLPIITIRPFHVYGPYEDESRLIPVLIKNILINKSPPLVSPLISRDMIYINDTIDLYLKIATQNTEFGEIYNLGSGKSNTIKEIFNEVKFLLKSNVKPNWNSMKNKEWDQKIWVSDMSKVKKKFNWKPKYSLKKGLRETINWYINYYSL